MEKKKVRKGLIMVFTGDGKGKTTGALGLAMRCCGHGLKVYMIQFMKGDIKYGEIKAAKHLPNMTIVQFGRPTFVDPNNPDEEDVRAANKAMSHAEEIVRRGEHNLVILDEVNVATAWGLVDLGRVLKLLREKPPEMHLVLTGRYAKPELIEAADMVSEVREIKHHYQAGVPGQEGIEY
ncbi:MAG: cob(I)yrinic acid a,c-diamide adenosyltransferase [Methanobacteriota archaeon]|nr:MAG: cob(I)yrinic acid a,c-diamide adenosyltransferase [Euryarchaeota archaeon]